MIHTLQLGQFGRSVIGAAGGGGGSAYKSRLQFGGADGSTTFTDDTGKVWTANGNAQIDTSLGDQRGLFDGSGDYITTPDHSDLQWATGEAFLIEFGLRFNSLTGFQTIMQKGYSPAVNGGWLLQTLNGNGRLAVYVVSGGGTNLVCQETSGTFSTGVDYDIKIRRTVAGATHTVTIERDGATTATGGNANNANQDFGTASAVFAIGGGSSTGFNNFWFNGWIKDFRASQ